MNTAIIDHPAHPKTTKIVVEADNHNHQICELDQLEDGFWYAVFYKEGGCWDSWLLKEIAEHIDQLNKPWLEILNATLGQATGSTDARDDYGSLIDWFPL